MSKQVKLPPVGSFPGYYLGRSLFTTWTTMLEQQADLWNANWARLISGDYDAKDYLRTLAQSLKTTSQAIEQMYFSVNAPGAPPWANLTFTPTDVQHVKTRRVITPRDRLKVAVLEAPFTGEDDEEDDGDEDDDEVERTFPVATATRVDSNVIAIAFEEEPRPTRGDYIGAVTTGRYSEPVAILTICVRPPRQEDEDDDE